MLFVVSRTSLVWSDDAPCPYATLRKIVNVESYKYSSPEEFDKNHFYSPAWLEEGTNHRVNEHGHITRDNGLVTVWTIEINSLEELLEFIDKYGDGFGGVVISPYRSNPSYFEIEIYDNYRE